MFYTEIERVKHGRKSVMGRRLEPFGFLSGPLVFGDKVAPFLWGRGPSPRGGLLNFFRGEGESRRVLPASAGSHIPLAEHIQYVKAPIFWNSMF